MKRFVGPVPAMHRAVSTRCRRALFAAVVMTAFGIFVPAAQAVDRGVTLNQDYVDQIRGERDFDIEDMMATFGFIFSSLDDEVMVYPTENYFYFRFIHKGALYAGNMRLDVSDRDKGILHFAYFSQSEPWNSELITQYKPLTKEDGVTVEKVEDFLYRVTFAGRSVLFRLNDLSGVRPPEGTVAESETYLGPVFDESGVQFYLLFDEALKQFRFVLNEADGQSDVLRPYSPETPVILIGTRTGFVFFDDRRQNRKLLVAVYRGNVDANNYFDGPFDQLPDNFIKGDELRQAILAKYPDLKDDISRLGTFTHQDGRFLVNPYISYTQPIELDAFYRCVDPGLDRAQYYACLTPEKPE